MLANSGRKDEPSYTVPADFIVQICSKDGRLLSEYGLSKRDHKVCTLAAAEHRAVMNLSEFYGEQLVIVISEETLTNLRQVQLKVAPANDDIVQRGS